MTAHPAEIAAPALVSARLGLVLASTDGPHRPRHTLHGRRHRTGIDVYVVTCPVRELVQISRLDIEPLPAAGRRIYRKLKPIAFGASFIMRNLVVHNRERALPAAFLIQDYISSS